MAIVGVLALAAAAPTAQDEIHWLKNLKQAQDDARESGKPLFVVFR